MRPHMNFPDLNLPPVSLTGRDIDGKTYVFDALRNKHVRLTPEEWVRQHWVSYLSGHLGVPTGLIALEQAFRFQQRTRRADLVVYDRQATPLFLLECKAPHIELSQTTFDQVALYNNVVRAPFLAISNGFEHFCCHVNHSTHELFFLPELLSFSDMVAMQSA